MISTGLPSFSRKAKIKIAPKLKTLQLFQLDRSKEDKLSINNKDSSSKRLRSQKITPAKLHKQRQTMSLKLKLTRL